MAYLVQPIILISHSDTVCFRLQHNGDITAITTRGASRHSRYDSDLLPAGVLTRLHASQTKEEVSQTPGAWVGHLLVS